MSVTTRGQSIVRDGRPPLVVRRARARFSDKRLLLGLVAIIAGLAALGAYMAVAMITAPKASAGPAQVGETVELPAGLLRVDAVIPEQMAPMQMDKFARSGMSMSGMVPDMTPEGYRRFIVQVTLAGRARAGLPYSPQTFRLTGESIVESEPLRSQLGEGLLPAGSTLAGQLVFQVPESASGLLLRYAGGGREIALELDPSGHDPAIHSLDEEEGAGHAH